MPKEKEISHPCHLLSLPSAKRFWCRHCMTVFEDAITRWRHSRSCRYGVVNNFMRRRELEAKALQNAAALNPVEARLEQSIQMCDLASTSTPCETDSNNEPQILSGPESYNCFICHEKFASMEEMRIHVKYPCSNSKIITSCAPHPRHSVPVFIDAVPGQTCQWQLPLQHSQNVMHPAATFVQTPQCSAQTSYDIDIQSQQEVESHYDDTSVAYSHSRNSTSDSITPTNIYVNEQGETVIEVENLDLNSEGGELSLAHLLTQLSQQGIVFDKSRSAQLQVQQEVTVNGDTINTLYTTEAYQQAAAASEVGEGEEEGQATAEDAANTLAQLAGFRCFSRTSQVQNDGEPQLHSQGDTVETYSCSDLSSEPSRQCTVSAQPYKDGKCEYEFSHTLSACEPSSVTAHQMVLQQVVVSASQEYDNVKVEHTAPEETVQYYSDSSNITYVTDQNNHHHIQMDREAISSIEDLKNNGLDNDGAQSLLIQNYPLQVNGSGQMIITPTIMSAHQVHETQTEYVVSEEHKVDDVEVLLSTASENSTIVTNLNANITLDSPESTIIAQGNPVQNTIGADGYEFATQTISLHEIVDPECKTFTLTEHTPMPQVSSSHCTSTEFDMPAVVTSSCEKQIAQYNICTSTDFSEDSERHSHTFPTERMNTHAATILVSSDGILPTSNTTTHK